MPRTLSRPGPKPGYYSTLATVDWLARVSHRPVDVDAVATHREHDLKTASRHTAWLLDKGYLVLSPGLWSPYRWLPIDEAAQALGVQRQTVSAYACRGKLPKREGPVFGVRTKHPDVLAVTTKGREALANGRLDTADLPR